MNLFRKILFPFSLLYGEIVAARNIFYNKGILRSTSFNIPIINVGNLSVGGTGKTPQVEYLARLLKDRYNLAILSRGYRRNTKGFLIADRSTTASDIGDEPMQYHAKFKNIIVAVDADRVNGIQQLKKLSAKPDVILLDDAYQHRKVVAGLNILLTSYDDLYVDDKMLPSGNLREKVKGAGRAQIIVVTKCPDELSEPDQFAIAKRLKAETHQTVFFSKIKYCQEIIGKGVIFPVSDLMGFEVVLVTGIANTKPLTSFLEKQKIKYHHKKYADHYSFSKKDRDEIKLVYSKIKTDKKLILTTEKDYVRSFIGMDNFFYLPIETVFIDDQKDFNKLIQKYVGQGSRNS